MERFRRALPWAFVSMPGEDQGMSQSASRRPGMFSKSAVFCVTRVRSHTRATAAIITFQQRSGASVSDLTPYTFPKENFGKDFKSDAGRMFRSAHAGICVCGFAKVKTQRIIQATRRDCALRLRRVRCSDLFSSRRRECTCPFLRFS